MSARLVSLFPCSPSSYCHIPLSLEDPIVQWPRTPPFHGGNTGSNPVRVANRFSLGKPLVPTRSLKEQFSKGADAWKEQSDPIFRFSIEGDWWGFPFFSLSASRYFGDKETLCLYWPLGTLVITGPKVLDFYTGFCAHRATCLKADGKEIMDLKLILNGDFSAD
jgi:hypothetical protein